MTMTGRDVRVVRPASLPESPPESVDAPTAAELVECPDCGQRHYDFGGCSESLDAVEELEPDYEVDRMVRNGF
jgi:hypothetical protein